MRVTISQDTLKRALASVNRAVSSKGSLMVLHNIMLATKAGRLQLSATDLNIAITCMVECKVEEEGAVTLPAKLLLDLVGNLPNGNVWLTLDDKTQSVYVSCARTKATIKGIEAGDFPPIPGHSPDQLPLATFDPDVLRSVISQVVEARSFVSRGHFWLGREGS